MRKVIKKIGICILVIVLLWGLLFLVDFFRLKDSRDLENRPTVVLYSERTAYRQSYHSLGYSVGYYLEDNHTDVYGMEIKVFGKIVYAWVE